MTQSQLKPAGVRDLTLDRAVRWLVDRQNPAGWWVGELETNVTMTAEHVLLLRFLGLPLDSIAEGARRHILSNQRADGSWALYRDGPADLSTTVEAYAALKVLGLDPDGDEMSRARRVIHEQGGLARARVFTKIWLALFGEYPWAGVPSMPPEMVNLPKFVPMNLYDFSCWARGTVAGLMIVISRRPARALGCSVSELVAPGTEAMLYQVPGGGPFWWADKLQKVYERLPVQLGRQASRNRLVRWIIERQEEDGSWGGIQPPWVYSLIALNLEGMELDHPVMRKGLEGIDKFALDDESGWRLQACMSPIWDTAWSVLALNRAGVDREEPAIQRAVDWLLKEQVFSWGDWQVRAGDVESGGWSFEFENDIYPDIDDTAVVAVALLQTASGDAVDTAVARAVRWVLGMRSRNGAWGSFDKDNTDAMVYRLPFADFGALIDPPTEDVTAHVLEMLANLGYSIRDRVVVEALAYLWREQRPDGSWWGRWGVNHIYGTWCVVSALTAFKERTGWVQTMIDRATSWLLRRHNADGGWGETSYSYLDPSFAGVGTSTPSQTAWAVISLQLAGLSTHPACRRGLEYLRSSQRDGTWSEPEFTGTGFPGDFYINYHLYRHVFPMLALAGDASP
ncbi:MAG TPA: squalene--hopene cyclase [Chloroflexota bacterium]|jgi:squalene-hopene/tetraprenyl-beta-curcumene cyclase|nr:squalene--hopene cyclase [Chloroflexota bacterium]